MDLNALTGWLSLKGYGIYVWPAYGLCAVAVAVEVMRVRRRLALARRPQSDTEPATGEQA